MPSWRTRPLAHPFAWKDVGYSAEPHAKRTLDVAIPRHPFPRRKLPACVFVHGGSWQRGDKNGGFNAGIDQAFVKSAGVIGVSVNYRLSPESCFAKVRHPEHAQDVATAVSWLHANIDKFGGDPDELVLVGHSAGAHVVMQLLSNPQYLADAGMAQEQVSKSIKGAVGISGVYNIVRVANTAVFGSLVTTPAFGERVDQWREASIVSTLTKQKAAMAVPPLSKIPLLLMNAEEDFELHQDAQELESWLLAAGHPRVERVVVPDRNHFTIIRDMSSKSEEDDAMQKVTAFVRSVVSPGLLLDPSEALQEEQQ